MTFSQSVETCLKEKYCCFEGRATRSEYWWFALFNFIVGCVASVLDVVIGTGAISIIVSLGLLLPGLGVFWRRMHDTGRSGLWFLLCFIPLIGAIILIVFACQDTQQGDNQYGPVPEDYYV